MPSKTADHARARIEIASRGPYVASGVETLEDATGRECQVTPTMSLCRCGHSGSKPFCDGAHVSRGFTGELGSGDSAKRDYVGRDITVSYRASICAHVGTCTTGLGAVFDTKTRPWIQPDAAHADEVRRAVDACPSGALSYPVQAGPAHTDPAPTIRVLRNGPLAVTSVELTGPQWRDGATPARYTLCRCGESRRMPFCDGTHVPSGFRDDAQPVSVQTAPSGRDVVMASFRRILAEGGFATTFYNTLFEADASVAALFADTDFEVQKPLLRRAVEVMIRVGTGDEGARADIERLAARHARDELNIDPSAYALWLDVLCQTLRRHDREFGPDLERAWRARMQVGIDVMKSRY